MVKNGKLKSICDFLFDGRLAVSVMFIYTVLLSTMLGKVGIMYLFPIFTTVWFSLTFLYRTLILKETLPKLETALTFSLLLIQTISLILRGSDFSSALSILINLSMLLCVFLCKGEMEDFPLYVFILAIIGFNVFSVVSSIQFSNYGFINSIYFGINKMSINPNLAGTLNLCGIIAVCLLIPKLFSYNNVLLKILPLFLIFFFAFFLYASYSRTTLVLVTLFFLIIAFFVFVKHIAKSNLKFKKAILTAVIIALAAISVIVSVVIVKNTIYISGNANASENSTFTRYFAKNDFSMYVSVNGGKINPALYDRYQRYTRAFTVFKESPILGVGQGNIRQIFIDMFALNKDEPWEYLHNGYIQVLTAEGIIAFTVFAALLLTVMIKGAAKTIGAIRGKYKNSLKIFTAFASILVLLTYNLIEGNLLMEYKQVGVLFWLAAGYLTLRTKPIENKD